MKQPFTVQAPTLKSSQVPPAMNLRDLRLSLRRPRTFFSALMTGLTMVLVLLAIVPLFSVLFRLFYRGVQSFGWTFFTDKAPYALQATGGGIGNAILGSVVMVLIASIISVPTGIIAAVFLAEIAPETRLAAAVRFCAKLLTGLPSIIAGVFVFGILVLTFGTFSAWAGGVALSLLMLPMVMLTSEEALKMVPPPMREAAYGIGCTRAQVIWRILLPTAMPGILTGIMLSLARAAGETAPLLFTAQYAPQSWVWEGRLRLDKPTQSLAVFIYENAGSAYPNLDQMAWGGALVLVLLVLCLNLSGQIVSWRTGRHMR